MVLCARYRPDLFNDIPVRQSIHSESILQREVHGRPSGEMPSGHSRCNFPLHTPYPRQIDTLQDSRNLHKYYSANAYAMAFYVGRFFHRCRPGLILFTAMVIAYVKNQEPCPHNPR